VTSEKFEEERGEIKWKGLRRGIYHVYEREVGRKSYASCASEDL
jgi:hypothetical protein